MATYEIGGVVPVIDPSAFVHPQASLIGLRWTVFGAYVTEAPAQAHRPADGGVTCEQRS